MEECWHFINNQYGADTGLKDSNMLMFAKDPFEVWHVRCVKTLLMREQKLVISQVLFNLKLLSLNGRGSWN